MFDTQEVNTYHSDRYAAWDDAYVAACKEQDPNSFNFDMLFNRKFERICAKRGLIA